MCTGIWLDRFFVFLCGGGKRKKAVWPRETSNNIHQHMKYQSLTSHKCYRLMIITTDNQHASGHTVAHKLSAYQSLALLIIIITKDHSLGPFDSVPGSKRRSVQVGDCL